MPVGLVCRDICVVCQEVQSGVLRDNDCENRDCRSPNIAATEVVVVRK